MKTALVLAGVLLASSTDAVAAQTLVRIEAERNYRLTYTDLVGQTHTVTVEPADKINPVVEAEVSLTPGGVRYEYSIWNLSEPLPSFDIASLRVPCDPDGLRNSEERLVLGHLDSPVCVFITFDDLLYPGGFAEGYTIESVALPALSTLRLSGLNPPVPWPSEEGTVPDQALELARSVRVGVNGWVAVPGIAPLRMPNEIGDPASFLGIIASDLGQVCDLLWITNQGVCNSLDTKLRAAAQSLDGGRLAAARGSLRAFLQELEAQHGDEPGKHVDANAYALLRVNVEYLLSILPRPSLPTVLAALVPIPGKSLKYNRGHFTVEYSCQDGTVTSATLNGWPVAVGDVANVDLKSKKPKSEKKQGKKSKKPGKSLKLDDTAFVLEVACENESGTTVVTASPAFPEKGSGDPNN